MVMRVSYYCQHVLGIGHLKRSLEICRHLAQTHETTLILGGPPAKIENTGLKILQLPGLQMDRNFKNLVPCDKSENLATVKETRQGLLYNHFRENQPHCFLTELYPFGRKAFRFELDPVLEDIKKEILPPCTCICSVRDILVEKTEGREKWEKRVIKTLNDYFNAILVHADQSVVRLDETFGPIEKTQTPLYYTGFVSEGVAERDRSALRNDLGISNNDTLIVVSAGGGNVGSELLFATADAFSLLQHKIVNARLQLFTGPYCDDPTVNKLQSITGSGLHISRYTEHFSDWLNAADLSISMAGYNTCMNLLRTGIPALVYPFMQNREQMLRAEKLARREPIEILINNDLQPQILAEKMERQLQQPRGRTSIKLGGGAETARIISTLLQRV